MKKRMIGAAVIGVSALMTLGTAFTSLADWTMDNGEWVYTLNNGEFFKDGWKEDGGHSYYLGSDGYMVRSSLLEINENYYYVNSSGAMVKNEWRELENTSQQSSSVPNDVSWYYFGSDGRAYRSKNGKAAVEEIGGKKYVFDEYGRMLTGWISESGEALTDESAWQDALYYGDGDNNGGALIVNNWLYTSVQDYDNEDDIEPSYWFYFSAAGKKKTSDQETINGKKYYFNEHGAAQTGWVQEDGDEHWHYYGDEEDCSLRTGWFEAVPGEDMDSEGYSDGTSYWFYAASDGDLAVSQIKTISGDVYAFNEYGELMTGLKKMRVENKEILAYDDIESEDDLPGDDEDDWGVYYMDENNGRLKTGNATIDLDGNTYTYAFKSSGSDKGRGIDGVDGNYIYDNGRRLRAESGTKYEIVVHDGTEYLVNTSGLLAKKKKNVTDSDGVYYCTDSEGRVTYTGYDRYTED